MKDRLVAEFKTVIANKCLDKRDDIVDAMRDISLTIALAQRFNIFDNNPNFNPIELEIKIFDLLASNRFSWDYIRDLSRIIDASVGEV